YGFAVLFTVLWCRRMPPLPWRLATEAGLVAIFLVSWLPGAAHGAGPSVLAPRFPPTRIPQPPPSLGRPRALGFIAIAHPFFVARLFQIPVFGAFPDVPTGIYMIVFMMMAVGLNIVVGYAGLLDLGYVAFYAIGAYTTGWFASSQFAGQKCPNPKFGIDNCPVSPVPKTSINFGGVGVPVGSGGSHLSIFLVLLTGGVNHAAVGSLTRAAPPRP